MEGAHRGGRRVKGGVVGSKSEASARQKRAQCGAAASGRRGQAVQIARAKVAEASSEDKAVEERGISFAKQLRKKDPTRGGLRRPGMSSPRCD